jgi:Flp pilus assembly protein TadB
VEYKPYKIAIPAKWEFTALVQGLNKRQIAELKQLRGQGIDIHIVQYPPLFVFFDQFRFKKYLKNDEPPLRPKKMSMILVLLFFWLAFLIFLIATPLAFYLEQPRWMVDFFCYIGIILLIIAVSATIYDRSGKRGFQQDFDPGGLDHSPSVPEGSISFPDLSDGEAIIILLIIMIVILLSMFFFVFIWLPILYVILNILTLRNVEDRYRTIEVTIKNPQENTIDWLASKIIFSGGYLSENWDTWIKDKNILRTVKITRHEHQSFMNFTIVFAIISFIFAFFLVMYRIFPHTYMFIASMIFGLIVLGIFVYLIFLAYQGRTERKLLFTNLYGG